MKALVKFYKLLNLLSIDVAVGSVVSALFFARLLEVALTLPVLFCLGLTVWLIYTVDHLLDARRIKGRATSQRHRLHQRYFGMLVISATLVLLVIFILLIEIPRPILLHGFLFSFLVVLYFIIHQRLSFLKELFGAILYSGGVLLPSFALMNNEMILSQYFIVLFFALTTLVNLILFSWCDREHDKADKHQSIVSFIGEKNTSRLLGFLFGGQLCIALVALMMPDVTFFATVIGAMNGVMFFMFKKWKWFTTDDRYRLLGDAIFFFPILTMLCNE